MTLDVDHIEEPDGLRSIREVIRHAGSVAVLPVHSDGTHLARQAVPTPRQAPGLGDLRRTARARRDTRGRRPPRARGGDGPYGRPTGAAVLVPREPRLLGGVHPPLPRHRSELRTYRSPTATSASRFRTFSLDEARTMAADGRIHDAKTLLAVVLEAERRLREVEP